MGSALLRAPHCVRPQCSSLARPARATQLASSALALRTTAFQSTGLTTSCSSRCCPLVDRRLSTRGRGHRQMTRMGNKSQGGLFAPIVVLVKKAVGDKQFNQLRGTAISKHSQVIQNFGKFVGANRQQVQGLIRTAKQNGGKLGFLA
eukprot:jgi/Astpho2/169/Aster-04630